ncbi:uncharacterized protein JCM10292_006199 [Rhodotorula paludigena]|uniref:uncharacterized protein n=1 Tax=Rhodotorula paludigena TaxID=86838 RepID=UPI003172BCF6
MIALPRWIQKNQNAKSGHTSYKWPTKTAEDLVESRMYTIAVEQDDKEPWHVVLQQTLRPGEVNLVGNHGLHGEHRTSIQHKLLIVRSDRARFECPVVFVDPSELGPPTESTTVHHPAERSVAEIGKGSTVSSRRHHRASVSSARW